MGKEAKLGVALIAVLLGVFGFALYKRLKDTKKAGEQTAAAAEEKPATPADKPKLSSGPLKPTMVHDSSTLKESNPGRPAASSSAAASHYPEHGGHASANDHSNAGSDPFNAASSNSPRSRYGDRYGSSSPPLYGSQEASDTSSTTGTSGSNDPFNRYSQRNSTLTPTADASSALLPASATEEREANKPAGSSSAATEVDPADVPAASNPLRSSTRESSTEPASNSSSRSTGPRSYDLYGGSSTTTETSNTSTTASEPPTSRFRFNDSAGSASRATESATLTSDTQPANTNTAPETRSSRYGSSLSSGTTAAASSEPAAPPARNTWSGISTANQHTTPVSVATPPSTAPASRFSASNTIDYPSRPAPATPVTRGETYVVQPNESLWTVAEKIYGNPAYFKALQEHNKARYPRPDLLKTGDVVETPSVEILQKKYPSLCPKPQHIPLPGRTSSLTSQRSVGGGRTYVVEEGDTLFDIARFELGKASRWVEIYELNKDVIGEDFNHLRPGTQLALPAESQSDTFTRRPSPAIKR